MQAVGMVTKVPAGRNVPSERVMSLRTLRLNETGETVVRQKPSGRKHYGKTYESLDDSGVGTP